MEARTLVKLGRLLAARDKYEETRHIQLPPDAPEALQRAVSDALREGEELRARTPMLRISILGKQPRPGDLKVTLDGKPVPNALLDVERPLDPGHQRSKPVRAGVGPIHRRIEHRRRASRGEIQLVSPGPDESLVLSADAGSNRKPPPPRHDTFGKPACDLGLAATGLGC